MPRRDSRGHGHPVYLTYFDLSRRHTCADIGEAAGVEGADISEAEDIASYDGLIFGAPTWHTVSARAHASTQKKRYSLRADISSGGC